MTPACNCSARNCSCHGTGVCVNAACENCDIGPGPAPLVPPVEPGPVLPARSVEIIAVGAPDEVERLCRSHERLRAELLAAKQPHLWLDEDNWYTCPKALDEEGRSRCINDDALARGVCNCGADEFNARIDAVLKGEGG